MYHPQSNTWDYNTWNYIINQVASIQLDHTTSKYPEDYGYSSSSSSTPRSNTPKCSIERPWEMYHNIESHGRNEKQDQVTKAIAKWRKGSRLHGFAIEYLDHHEEEVVQEDLTGAKRGHANEVCFPPMIFEPKEPIDSRDEEEIPLEAQEYEFTTYVYLEDQNFTNCLVSSEVNYNVMTYKACRDAGFVPTTKDEENPICVDDMYQIRDILKSISMSPVGSSSSYLMDIWVLDVSGVASIMFGKTLVHVFNEIECTTLLMDGDNKEEGDKELNMQYDGPSTELEFDELESLDESHDYPCQDKRSHLEDDNFSEIDYNYVEVLYEEVFLEDLIINLFSGDQLSKKRHELLAKICLASVLKELKKSLYDETCDRSYQEDEKAMDTDDFLDNYTSLLENEDDVSSST